LPRRVAASKGGDPSADGPHSKSFGRANRLRGSRDTLGLPQAEFPRRYAVSPRSLQEWEQGRRRPESAVRAYLTVIDRNPKAVEKALINKS
jgi:putative transcriptional regulator